MVAIVLRYTLLFLLSSFPLTHSIPFRNKSKNGSNILDYKSTVNNHSAFPSTSLIINGIESGKRLFYARVRFGIDGGYCGATIIQRHYVLTAAHCVYLLQRKISH